MSALWNANKLQGADVATTAPANGDVLKYNSTTSSWTPAQASGITSLTGSIIATGNGEVTAYIRDGAVQYVKIQQMPGQTLMGNSQTGNAVVAPISIGAGLTLNAGTSVLSAANTSALWNANQLQGRDVNNTAPTNGQVLKWNGSAWAPGADAGGSITLQDDITGTGTGTISTTISNKAVTYAKMQDVTGSRLLGRYATTAGTAQEISLGTTMSLSTGGVLSAANTTALWNANELQGRDIATTAPTNGQVLKWNGTLWAPAADASGSISLTGPITGTSSTGTIATTITDDAVTFAKMQDVSTQRLLGRYSTGTGDVQEVSLGANMLLNTSGQLSADANNALWNANKFQGRSIVSATPTNGQVYKYNTSTSTGN
ncbi:hypothetical protein MKQ70_21925 [Chitinophaga sedimenti]|uniref:hypothetical protein n=1 Tax=Chitinophaga sedimenti TaxID=2033606 RepID=UPI0020069391|nr:hypothetical protein [Chitinophaga sedimenti]MCK7557516.1 hypothetical protein [Chitinophaga sedimenti]